MKKFFLIIVLFSNALLAQQKCKLRIYTEIDNYYLYIDNKLIGKNIDAIDTISCEDHYIKVMFDNVIVFSEILSFKENESKSILIKKTKEVEEKLLKSKAEEIEQYKREKVEVMISKKYITTTDVNLQHYSYNPMFPNYYSLNYAGATFGQNITSTQEITDWFFVKGGSVKLNELDFIKLHSQYTSNIIYLNQVSNQIKQIDDQNKIIEKKNKKKSMWMNFGGIVFLIGTLLMAWGFIEILVPLFLTSDTAINVFFFGLGGFLIGMPFTFMKTLPYLTYPEHFLKLEDAMKMKDEYNAKLKEKLGLPKDFDVIK
ncbi:MAG: hypothetical protein KatS3mg027_1584 [Bacteroidia bacterium]|nr:MAG: hypothetical protein KatS3mg027_1584 [Bacteroidia bacterium]